MVIITAHTTDAHFPAARMLGPGSNIFPVYLVLLILYLLPVCTGELGKVCGTVRTKADKSVVLREGVSLTFEEFENVRLKKLKDAFFAPVEKCAIKVCGYTWTDKPFHDQIGVSTRNYADCEIIKQGNASKAFSNIYNDSFNVTSISCGCERNVTDCKVGCLNRIKAGIEWKENQCAILYEESNCGQCWFPPVILHQGEKYTTNNSHFIQTVILRDDCKGEHSFPGKSGSNRYRTVFFNSATRVIDKSVYQFEFSTFGCTSNFIATTTIAPTTQTALVTTNALMTSPSSLSVAPGTIVQTSTAFPFTLVSCATIKPVTSPAVDLFENSYVNRTQFENIRVGKLRNATFSVGTNWNDQVTCLLEICGFSRIADPYRARCEWFTEGNITASAAINMGDYEVSSMSCSCTIENDLTNCETNKCLIKYAAISWQDQQCAVMYREKKCNSCYFKPIIIRDKEPFYSLNSYVIKSLLVRPGCTVVRATKVSESWDGPWFDWRIDYEGIYGQIGPSYYRDSDNFTCFCNPGSATPVVSTLKPTTTEPVTTTEEPVTSTVEPNITTTDTPDTSTTMLPSLPSTVANDTKLATLSIAIFSVGLVIVIAVASFLIKRYKNGQMSTNNQDTIINSTTERNDNGSNGTAFPIEKVYLGDGESIEMMPFSAPIENAEESSTSELDLVKAYDLSSLVEVVETVQTHKDTSQNENPLKVEIIEEVKRLMESFLGSLGQSELEYLRTEEPLQRFSVEATAHAQSVEESDSIFPELLENFHQVCKPDHVLSRNMFTIPNRNWERPVGKGQVGIVYKGQMRLEPDGLVESVAIKKIKWPGSQDSVVQSFLREIKAFECIGAENDFIVRYFGACCHPDGLYIVTKFCEGGSLKGHLIEKMRPKVFPNEGNTNVGDGYFMTPQANLDLHQLFDWCAQICCGMEYLSNKRIIHVDLACRNILLSDDNTVKICDFGLSKKCLNKDDCAQSLLTGDFPFNSFAPECNTDNVYAPRQMSLYVDIWAFGCTAWEIFTLGDALYQDVQEEGLYKLLAISKLLRNGYRHPKPELAPNFVYDKLLECWSEVPQDRPNFTRLCNFFEAKRLEIVEN